MEPFDCRTEVFRERGQEVLASVVQGTQVTVRDPYDVEQVHAEARRAFEATLQQVRAGSVSRILLVRGEAGCGKTHLIRALRAQTHERGDGVIAYVHMTSEHGDYRQYLLRHVVKSLSDPYVYQPGQPSQSSALDLISDALTSLLEGGEVETLQDAEDGALTLLVSDLADRLSEAAGRDGRARFADVDLNVLRIMLYRQSARKPIQRRVGSFLNGEPLSDLDWSKLAAMPRDCDRAPMYLLNQLARITSAALGVPLIVCIDQIEASDITGRNHDPFLRAMGTACELIETTPHMMVLLSCLDSAYHAHSRHLIESYRHRIENDPQAVDLTAARSEQEVRQILSRRLKGLYESEGLEHIPPDSVFPLPEDAPGRLRGRHIRVVLQQIRGYWEQCHLSQSDELPMWEDVSPEGTPPDADGQDVDRLRIAWNEYRTARDHAVVEDDAEQMKLLAWALGQIPSELPDPATVELGELHATNGHAPVPGVFLSLNIERTPPISRLIGLCDKDPRGNGLLRQIDSLASHRRDAGQLLVVFRSTRLPRTGKALERIEELKKAGDVFVVAEDSCWRTMQAMRSFLAGEAGAFKPQTLAEWRRTDGPLVNLPEISSILQLRQPALRVGGPAPDTFISPSPGTPGEGRGERHLSGIREKGASSSAESAPLAASQIDRALTRGSGPGASRSPIREAASGDHRQGSIHSPVTAIAAAPAPLLPPLFALQSGPLVIGTSEGHDAADVVLPTDLLTRHTAIFGANGSGKTALAMTIVEMLLERGIGVVLFDRKGDLAAYASETAWLHETGAPDEQRRRAALRAHVDVHLYTPGCAAGRPLVLPWLPAELREVPEDQREEEARQAALILRDVCAPTASKSEMFAIVLTRAVELLCYLDAPRTIGALEDFLLQSPPELLIRLPAHGAKQCEEVGRRLNERRMAYGRLFSDEGERLDLPRMFTAGAGRVRLNIISTQFLDGDASLIWVAQFLAAAGQFMQRSPAPDGRLQALLMFDEADQYVPANRKPAAKLAMERLLRQARAAGVGVILASQNVGDLDLNVLDDISTVFAGKLATARVLDKLRPRLRDAVERLPNKSRGQFVMGIENEVRDIWGHMCLVEPLPIAREEIERIAARRGR